MNWSAIAEVNKLSELEFTHTMLTVLAFRPSFYPRPFWLPLPALGLKANPGTDNDSELSWYWQIMMKGRKQMISIDDNYKSLKVYNYNAENGCWWSFCWRNSTELSSIAIMFFGQPQSLPLAFLTFQPVFIWSYCFEPFITLDCLLLCTVSFVFERLIVCIDLYWFLLSLVWLCVYLKKYKVDLFN